MGFGGNVLGALPLAGVPGVGAALGVLLVVVVGLCLLCATSEAGSAGPDTRRLRGATLPPWRP